LFGGGENKGKDGPFTRPDGLGFQRREMAAVENPEPVSALSGVWVALPLFPWSPKGEIRNRRCREAPPVWKEECFARSVRGGDFSGIHIDAASALVEADFTIAESENGEVFAEADVATGFPFRAALAGDDVTGDDDFTAEFFHAEAFAVRVASVFDGALSLFVSHESGSFWWWGGKEIRKQ
jgi:hypothetical protein